MAAFAFSLPILPGQDGVVRRIGKEILGEFREEYEASRRTLGSEDLQRRAEDEVRNQVADGIQRERTRSKRGWTEG